MERCYHTAAGGAERDRVVGGVGEDPVYVFAEGVGLLAGIAVLRWKPGGDQGRPPLSLAPSRARLRAFVGGDDERAGAEVHDALSLKRA